MITIRPEDLIFGNVTVAYERLLGASGVGLKVPVSWGIGHQHPDDSHSAFYYQFNKIVGTGLEANFYMTPAERFRYFVGPAFQWARYRYLQYEYGPPGLPYGYPTPLVLERVGQQLALVVNGGVWHQVGARFVFSANAGLGWQTLLLDPADSDRSYAGDYGNRLKFSGNFNLGYQF